MRALRHDVGMRRRQLSGRVPLSDQDALRQVLGSRQRKRQRPFESQKISIDREKRQAGGLGARRASYELTAERSQYSKAVASRSSISLPEASFALLTRGRLATCLARTMNRSGAEPTK